MFICEPCLTKNYTNQPNPPISQSEGLCEKCEQKAVCSDIHHNELVRRPRKRTSTGPQGFATLSPERRREISSMGGKAAHAEGTAHVWTPEQAKAAGRKGGAATHAKLAAAKAAAAGASTIPAPPTTDQTDQNGNPVAE